MLFSYLPEKRATGALLLEHNLLSFPVHIHIFRQFVGLVKINGGALVIITLVNGPQINDQLSGWLGMTARPFSNGLLVSLTGRMERKGLLAGCAWLVSCWI